MKEIRLNLTPGKGEVSTDIYGQFIELLGDCVYGGVYDENSSLSDENGIRLDVLEKAKELLAGQTLSVADIGRMVGYDNPSYFASVFRNEVGVVPREYRDRFA